MKLTPNENVLRVALIVFSVIFGVLSLSLIALGAVYMDELWWPGRYVGLDFLELPTMLIVLGSISFIMAIVGCFCAKSYNRKLLIIFGVVLLVILCLEFAISIIAFINLDEHKQGHSSTHQQMSLEINSSDEEQRLHFNNIEEHYKCCGVYGVEDKCISQNTTESYFHQELGCAVMVDEHIQTIAREVGYYALVLSFLQGIQIGYVYLIQHHLSEF